MSDRVWAARFLLPTALIFERFAYYGMRALLVLALMSDWGMDRAAVMSIYRWFTVGALLAPFLGAAVAAGTGGGIAATAGGFLLTASYGLLAVAASTHSQAIGVLGLVGVALGGGLVRPGLMASLGELSADPQKNLRNGTFLLLYAGVNFGAFCAPLVIGSFHGGGAGGYAIAMGIAALAALLATGLLGLATGLSWETPKPPRTGDVPELGLLLVLPLSMLFWFAVEVQGQVMFQTEAGQEPWLQSVNPIVVMALCSLLAVVLLALHRSFPIPTFLPVGLGFLLLGGGLLVSVAGTSLPVLIASTALIAAGESFAAPFFAARLASGVNWRVAPVLLAALTASTWAVNEAASPASEIGGGVLAAIGILACLVGVALMPLAGILERALYGDPERPAR